MKHETTGWAVMEPKNRGILVNTVSDTRRASLVNWLISERNEMVRAVTTDDQIETMWAGLKGEHDICTVVRLHPVYGNE